MLEISIGTSFHTRKGPNGMPAYKYKKKSCRVRGVRGGGEGGGYVKNVNRTNNADISLSFFFSFFLFFFFFFLRLRLRYIQLIKFMCLLVEMCELLVNLRRVVTKVMNK